MNKRLFVAGLPFSTKGDELITLFKEAGNVVAGTIISDRQTGRSKGFGFVEMETEEEALLAIEKFNNYEFGGRNLIVSAARPKEEKSRPHGKFHGGFGRNTHGGFNGHRRSAFGQRREGGRGNFGRGRSDR